MEATAVSIKKSTSQKKNIVSLNVMKKFCIQTQNRPEAFRQT